MDKRIQSTIEYYNRCTEDFCRSTASVDLHPLQEKFPGYLPDKASILDFGCGSGRDTKYFLSKGYTVSATDGSAEFCRLASAYTGISVRHEYFQDLSEVDLYDGIWACSSILHVRKAELPNVFIRMTCALKKDGIIYTSFKYGDFEGERNGRYFSDFTEKSFAEVLSVIKELYIREAFITGDVRNGRSEVKLLNLILQKQYIN